MIVGGDMWLLTLTEQSGRHSEWNRFIEIQTPFLYLLTFNQSFVIGRLICATDSDFCVTLVNMLLDKSVFVIDVLPFLILILSSFVRPLLLFYCCMAYYLFSSWSPKSEHIFMNSAIVRKSLLIYQCDKVSFYVRLCFDVLLEFINE